MRDSQKPNHEFQARAFWALTSNGEGSLELCFWYQGLNHRWEPPRSGLKVSQGASPITPSSGARWEPPQGGFSSWSFDDSALSKACREYLRSRGREFNTLDELQAWAESHNWPELDGLRNLIKVWKKRSAELNSILTPNANGGGAS